MSGPDEPFVVEESSPLLNPSLSRRADAGFGASEAVTGAAALLALGALLFFPSAFRFLFGVSSLTAGLLAACGVVGVLGLLGLYRFEAGPYWNTTLGLTALMVFVILLQGAIATLWYPIALGRGAGSLAVAVIMALVAYQIRTILLRTTPDMLNRATTVITGLLLVIALLSLLELQPASVTSFSKPIFPFTEPSHFALTFAPFLIYQCVRARLPIKLAWLTVALALAYLLQNLSLVVAVAVAAACCLSGPFLLAGLAAVGVVIQSLDVTYFTDRLDFSAQTTNLSALVYIQGMELMESALRATSGWGIGFQQLGIAPINVPTSDLIYRLSQDDLNLRDGGFLAAKLIAELGMIGFALVVLYVFVVARAAIAIRRISAGKAPHRPLPTFVLAVIVAFSVELFVRGAGYFTGTVTLMMAALLLTAEGGLLRRSPKAER